MMRVSNNQEKDVDDVQIDIQQYLAICAQASVHINRIQHTIRNISKPQQCKCKPAPHLSVSHTAALEIIEECAEMLASTSLQLRNDMAILRCHLDTHRLHISQCSDAVCQGRHVVGLSSSTRACSSDRAYQARINTFEAISTANGSQQILVSTSGNAIHARNVTNGSNSVQLLGQMSEISLQQLSNGNGLVSMQSVQQQEECRDN